MLVVLSEASFRDPSSINGRELHAITEAARLYGCRIYALPPDFDEYGSADDALTYVPAFDRVTPGIWVGYIPSPSRYLDVYQAALARNVHLINSPEQYLRAMEFDRFYPFIQDLTPESRIITSTSQAHAAAAELGYPLFVKGTVKSNKEQGWDACVASTEEQLTGITEGLLARQTRSRGKIILRTLVELRTVETTHEGFPLGREYRVFLYGGQVLARGFYWDEYSDPRRLSNDEEKQVDALAREAARRLDVPFLAVDIGQLASGDWIIIEVGDGQFSGLSQVPVLELWSKLTELLAQS